MELKTAVPMQTGAKTFFAQPQQGSQLAAILVHHLERQASCPQESYLRTQWILPAVPAQTADLLEIEKGY